MWERNCLAILAGGLLFLLDPAGAAAQNPPSSAPSAPAPALPQQGQVRVPRGSLRPVDQDLEAEQRLLELLQTAHRATTGEIHTFSCRFSSQTDTSEGLFDEDGEYWRSLDTIRIRSNDTMPGDASGEVKDTNDYFINAGRVSNYSVQVWGKNRHAGGLIAAAPCLGPDVWWLALITFSFPPDPPMTLDELLRKPNKSCHASRVERWGHEVIYLEVVTEDNRRIQLWFDPQFNYLARKMAVDTKPDADPGKASRGDHEVTGFTEVAPGIYFPERVGRKYESDVHPDGSGVTTFTQIRVNEPLAADVFQFRFPAGLEILDSVESKMYKVSDAGALEELKDRPAFNISSLAHGVNSGPSIVEAPVRESPAGPLSNIAEFLLGLVAVLLLVTAWLLVRRKHRPAGEVASNNAEGGPTQMRGRLLKYLPWLAAPTLAGVLCYLLVRDPTVREQWHAVFGGPPILDCPASIELGQHDWGKQIAARFTIRNTGHSELVLDQIRTNCICAGLEQEGADGKATRLESLRIGSGEEAKVIMRVNIRTQVGAPFRSALSFNSNDPTRPEADIEFVIANVTGGITAVPTRVDFGDVPIGARATKVLEVRDTAAHARPIKTVTSSQPDLFTVRLLSEQENISAKPADGVGALLGRIEVLLESSLPRRIEGYVLVTLDDSSITQDKVPVRGTVTAAVEAVPSSVFLPRHSSTGPIYSIECLCRSTSCQPLLLVPLDLPPGVSAEISSARDSVSQQMVRISIKPELAGQPIGERDNLLQFRARVGAKEETLVIPLRIERRGGTP